VAACGVVSAIGSGEDPTKAGSGMTTEGGSSTQSGGKAGSGTVIGMGGSNSMGAFPGKGGSDPGMGGVGAGPGTGLCMADTDCAGFDAPCEMCPGGSVACQKTYCDGGKCVTVGDSCAAECKTEMDCPVPDGCKDCGGKELACPAAQCLMGKCQISYPSCTTADPCKDQACGTPCKPCDANGMCDPVMEPTYCDGGGKCVAGLPTCADPGMCKTAMDCGTPPPKCVPCANDTCATFDCIQGSCVFACPANPTPECKTQDDCPQPDCKMCPGGKCADMACLQGSCELVCPL
jgi:hypothetical protein